MANDWTLDRLTTADGQAMLSIFNHYIAHGFAAYLEEPASVELMNTLLEQAAGLAAIGARDAEGALIGFSMLRPYIPHVAFSRTAQVTTFIAPGHTGRGLGTAMLEKLEGEARTLGLESILAHVSSRNPGSLAFHHKHGFVECGRFREIGLKRGKVFDIVWFQKML